MAITIRNRKTEELIRKIGRRTGEGPSAVILRLAEREVLGHDAPGVSQDAILRRTEFLDDLHRRFPPPDPRPTAAEIETDIKALYDGDDLADVEAVEDKA